MERFKRAWEESVQPNLLAWVIFAIVSYFVSGLTLYLGIFPIIVEVRAAAREKRAPEVGNLFDFSKWGQFIPYWLIFMALNVVLAVIFLCIVGGAVLMGQVNEVLGMICSFLGLLIMLLSSLAINFGAFMAPWVMTSGKFAPLDSLKVSFAFAFRTIVPIVIHALIASVLVMIATILCYAPVAVAVPVALVATSYFYDDFEPIIIEVAQQKQIPIKE